MADVLPEDYELDDDYDETCLECDGEGQVLVCIDDICHGLGYCMHGDGMAVCRACSGTGHVPPR